MVPRFAGSNLGLKCVVGAKVYRIKPWIETCGVGFLSAFCPRRGGGGAK